MPSRKTTTVLLIGLSVLLPLAAAVEALLLAPQLPEQMATHFGGNGHADGWMSKRSAFVLTGTVGLVVVLPLAFLPLLFHRLPHSKINLPHREYWLAPERRAESLGYLATWTATFVAGTNSLLAWTQHLLLMANLSTEHPRLDPAFGWVMLAYLFVTVLGTFALFARFRRPADSSQPA